MLLSANRAADVLVGQLWVISFQQLSDDVPSIFRVCFKPQILPRYIPVSYYLDNWDSIDFDDKRKAADGLISTIKATSDRVQIEWKI